MKAVIGILLLSSLIRQLVSRCVSTAISAEPTEAFLLHGGTDNHMSEAPSFRFYNQFLDRSSHQYHLLFVATRLTVHGPLDLLDVYTLARRGPLLLQL